MRIEIFPEVGDFVVVRTDTFTAEGPIVAVNEEKTRFDVNVQTQANPHIVSFYRGDILIYLVDISNLSKQQK